jgi:leucyl-tRNA---protein transferase
MAFEETQVVKLRRIARTSANCEKSCRRVAGTGVESANSDALARYQNRLAPNSAHSRQIRLCNCALRARMPRCAQSTPGHSTTGGGTRFVQDCAASARGPMRVLQVFREPERACSYLPSERAQLEHALVEGVTPVDLERLLASGVRRFGLDYFQPRCASCHACIPCRVPASTFVPSRSQKRVLKRNLDLDIEVGIPSCDRARLDLYERWHGKREEKRGWEPTGLDARGYAATFAMPHPCAVEVTYWSAERELIGVSIVDETPNAMSAVYFFSSPELAERSLGVFNVLTLTRLAAERGKAHLYLGFLVSACPSLSYKARFNPQEHRNHSDGMWRLAVAEPDPEDDMN